MEKIKLKITRYDLSRFSFYVEENNIKFKGDYDIYINSIYYASGASSYLDWNENDLDEGEIKLLVAMLNVLIKSHKLHYAK